MCVCAQVKSLEQAKQQLEMMNDSYNVQLQEKDEDIEVPLCVCVCAGVCVCVCVCVCSMGQACTCMYVYVFIVCMNYIINCVYVSCMCQPETIIACRYSIKFELKQFIASCVPTSSVTSL